MGLFDLFKTRSTDSGRSSNIAIPEEIFTAPISENSHTTHKNGQESNTFRGITALYEFLEENHEESGYNDALIHADISYRDENIKRLRSQLLLQIQKCRTYYSDYRKELETEIENRSRAGLIDLVEQLKTRKEIVLDHLSRIDEIDTNKDDSEGVVYSVYSSYIRGFNKGLAAISTSILLK